MTAIQMIRPGLALEMREVEIPRIGPRDVLVRVKAAGICHSDAHYRAGISPVSPLPLTLGHEVAGIIERAGTEVSRLNPGDRVCLHYLATCGECVYCHQGREQFCSSGKMIGKHREGGYAEYIAVPARSVFPLPEEIPFEHGAIMMCSSATALHALRKARLKPGESVAVFGVGGLGISAVQLAKASGALEVFAIDIKPSKLAMAERFGAVPINSAKQEPVETILHRTGQRGVDVALELIGLPLTMRQAVRSLAIGGRAALAGITNKSFEVAPYGELLNKETEIIGVSDHLAQELPVLLRWAKERKLALGDVVTRTIPLDAAAVNQALDQLERFGEDVRVVIVPES